LTASGKSLHQCPGCHRRGKVTIETENIAFDEAYYAVHPGFACGIVQAHSEKAA